MKLIVGLATLFALPLAACGPGALGGAPESELLSAAGFDAPITVSAATNALSDNQGRMRPGDNTGLIGGFMEAGLLRIEATTAGPPWWHFVTNGEGAIQGQTLTVEFGRRKVTGRAEQRRWTEDSTDYFAETITYAIEPEPRFASIAKGAVGSFSARLVATNNPRVGRWTPQSISFDRTDESATIERVIIAAGGSALEAVPQHIETAQATAYDMIEADLAERGILAVDATNSDVLVSRNAGLAFYRRFSPLSPQSLPSLLARCDQLAVQGYGKWRLPSAAELARIFAKNQSGYFVYLADAPDRRL
jgi:hypothetical protein